MPIVRGNGTENARGGSELMADRLERSVPAELLERFQIFISRVDQTLDPSRVRILWCHDMDTDPAVSHLADGGWDRFHRIVFVSNWQAQRYIERFGIPWSRTIVMANAIEPIHGKEPRADGSPVRLVYTPTPHRGLNVLAAAFEQLRKEDPMVELDVYSSFSLYGWDQRDEQFRGMFDHLRGMDGVRYNGAVDNPALRQALREADVFAYPSTWAETSCLCLMEAMSAGLHCVHPNYGALYETAGNMTLMYPWDERPEVHASRFLDALRYAVASARAFGRSAPVKSYADRFYNWEGRASQWRELLGSLRDLPTDLPGDQFVYRVG